MDDLLNQLIEMALAKKASDIHFVLENKQLRVSLRTMKGMVPIYQDLWSPAFFEYLKFHAHFDLTNPFIPQSGQFAYRDFFCRFSCIVNHSIQTGVLRILQTQVQLRIEELTRNKTSQAFFYYLTTIRQGLVISVGPTNSGKTTTLHALLHEIAIQNKYKVVSLEDPIVIEDHAYLQLQINAQQGFTYEKGIEELLRHDPDVICIGETRDAYTAKMVIRAALTGHLVFTTLHATDGLDCIQRLLDFGVDAFELAHTLNAVFAQRLYLRADETKECVYEILQGKELVYALENGKYDAGHITLSKAIQKAIKDGDIADQQAEIDMQSFQR